MQPVNRLFLILPTRSRVLPVTVVSFTFIYGAHEQGRSPDQVEGRTTTNTLYKTHSGRNARIRRI